MAYGTVLNFQGANKWLQEYNKTYNNRNTWQQMYAATDLAAQQAESSLKYDFAQDMADAYSAALTQKSNIYSGSYRSGVEQSAISEVDIALKEAYESSLENYQRNVNTIAASKQSSQEQINNLLQQQTQNYIDYTTKHFDYLTWLDEQAGYDVLKNSDFAKYYDYTYNIAGATKADGSSYTKDELLHYISTISDEFSMTNLLSKMSTDELLEHINTGKLPGVTIANATLKDIDSLYSDFFDDTGKLTKQGRGFFDLTENYYATQGDASKYSIGSYLSTLEDSNLLNWAMSTNQYDYDQTLERNLTNQEAYRKFIGLDKNDAEYSGSDSLKYMTDAKLQTIIRPLKNSIDIDPVKTGKGLQNIRKSSIDDSKFMKSLEEFTTNYNTKYGISMPDITAYKTVVKELNEKLTEYKKTYEKQNDLIGSGSWNKAWSEFNKAQAALKRKKNELQTIKQQIVSDIETILKQQSK